MAEVLTLHSSASRPAASIKPAGKARKPGHRASAKAQAERKRLTLATAAYMSDLAVAIQRATARGVADEMVSVIHTLAIRLEQLSGAVMTLTDEVALGDADTLPGVEELLQGRAASQSAEG